MENAHQQNKHLTYEERQFIEIGLNNGRNFTEISKDLNKHRTTIMRETLKHRFKKMPSKFNNRTSLCSHRNECKKYDCNEKKNAMKKKFVHF